MDIRTLAPLAVLLLLLAPAALGATGFYHRDVVGPSASYNTMTGTWHGHAQCDYAGSNPLSSCPSTGTGATIDLDDPSGDLNDNGAFTANPAAGNVWASGTCEAGYPGAPAFLFLCGVDRDDDGAVTNVDPTSGDPDGFDDDFDGMSVPSGSGLLDVCFRADGGALTPSSTLGASWDNLHVFIAQNVPGPSTAAGVFSVDVALSTRASGCPSGQASGHSHDSWVSTGVHTSHPCLGTACSELLLVA